ncbi:peptidoglycan-associated lipoprotein Pal [Prosthecochloris sp. N3]|uniref:Peptidoglycan-associated protein n=1 Tax=Prosthecochloris ethylica TaxID=2743976 RepID=A0ABR9XRM6_9CHLB|nr:MULTISPECIES: peptidoglycan-associated lipoprotein Pal [Prosthecochloris]MEC9486597.1 peptidoglycan-associated lipoprotein Pal [Prosthecochloris sp.]MBF0586796.1 peptidoglycan-associated lipoprotein Pal [Prosthecochloris ethylica]MBF0636702.1 peptidoglycan-associated lipoprotein Pal [Prosthecochloris ethylica]NUK47899.1 peptidoglycan-associated lipoprotein Pal [Prosthecochloris ethylica]RNA65202.1 peptidoglycan-associated lipoprotein Pal [Prosthecochloris sp. ZM_2]
MKKVIGYTAVIVALCLGGCASESGRQASGSDAAGAGVSGYDGGPVSGYSAQQEALRAEAARVLKDVFFGFESADIDVRSALQLKRNAEWLRTHPSVRVMIEGHCDERGTAEYNMALGERRAEMAKEFLVKAGVSASRMQTVSYGEERPFDPGHDESAWAQNRRAHFVVQ